MKRLFLSAVYTVLFLIFVSGLSAQNVNREELETNQASVDFINYEGPYAVVNTIEQIRNIGVGLGQAVRNGANNPGLGNRYFVIHCTAAPDGDKYDADLFGLGIDVGVDHIRNLRLIIQGYLQSAYDYSAADASLLSRYVTIYNAVFRGNWDFFTDRYKNIVLENLTREKAGLSIRYDEWPGQTLIVIPLGTGRPGSLSAIDTSGLSDPDVIDSMRSEEGRGIEDRQGMVGLQEREAEEASQRAALQREAIAEQERAIQREREEAARAQQQAQQQQQQAQQQQQQAQQDAAAGTISAEEAQRRQQEAARQEQQARQAEQEAQARQQEAARQEQQVEQSRREAEAAQQLADQRAQQAQQERQQIARDQQEMIDSGSTAGTTTIAAVNPGAGAAAGGGGTGLLAAGILQNNTALGRLVRVDPNNGSTIQSSNMNTVNTRTVTLSGTRIFAIAGINQGNSAIRLVEINGDTLNMLKQGNDDIHLNSLLWVNGANLYAIIVVNGKNYMARFDVNLVKQAQSEAEVHTYASCLIQGDRIITQKTDGTPLLLNGQTLR